ncbi:UvrY/SirA/GacA family response regulator transcription factor [Bowmanella sp. JS7-9]|uniref:UvrY/SirA/GacA family response regulator transcription factor n=1 Tax=Pseudobowmanella zhangzhouensis TaxID=1537679 RepID=A0ABW1XIM6_9ALTE|nr:UvrY/SirA/GacA family response regulator transcription factor [Bowmanella sp. JS7-9]TBX26012.1 response regulator [Bowmanella sp. JS7-9]
MIKILLVDDHDLIRTGLRRILDDVRGFKVVGEAGNGEDAIRLVRQLEPDVVLMDMNMPGMGGMEATKKILRINDGCKVIVISVLKENPYPAKVMQLGAHGYLTKDAGADEMIRAIHQVVSGQKYIDGGLAQQIALGKLDLSTPDPFEALSERELQIMTMISKGQKVPDIASQLNLSAKTVLTYKYRAFEKLGVEGEVELVHLVLRHKLINSETL